MRKTRTILPISILASMLLLTSCNNEVICPKYENNKRFNFYAYACPSNGYHSVNGDYIPGKTENGQVVSFQTVEKYKEYQECGFDTLLIDADDAYVGEEFSTSKLKSLMDKANTAGLKTIIFDNRIYTLSTKTKPIVGEGLDFASQEDLEIYLTSCIQPYKDHPAFYGLLVKDEPNYQNFPAIGSIFKAFKKIDSTIFLQCNLFPLSPGTYASYSAGASASSVVSAYKSYLEGFMESTNSSYIMADSYPMKMQNESPILDPNHIKTIQMLCETGAKYNAEVYAVAQSSSWKNSGILKARKCEQADMYWQTNFYMGMGIKQISYFTYQTKKTNRTNGEYFIDGASFIKWNGDKTPMYDYMKRIHSEMQKFAPTVLSFDYTGLSFYKNGLPDVSYLGGVNKASSFKKISSVTTSNNAVCLVTELYDKENDRYMYMFLNTANPATTQNKETVNVQFKDSNAVSVYKKGNNKGERVSGKYSFDLKPGEAEFIIPFNA